MRTIAVIPCRGGSVAIPRKNLHTLNGITLLEKTIRQAQESGIDVVAVSTEDAEIQMEAERCGATVIPRPLHLAQGDVMVWEAVKNVAEHYQSCGAMPDLFVEMHTTYPFRTPALIANVLGECDLSNEWCSVMCASEFFDRIWRRNRSDGFYRAVPDLEVKSRQEQEPLYIDHYGLVNCYSPEVALQGNPYRHKIEFYVVNDRLESFDIDDPGDMQIAERIANSGSYNHRGLSGIW